MRRALRADAARAQAGARRRDEGGGRRLPLGAPAGADGRRQRVEARPGQIGGGREHFFFCGVLTPKQNYPGTGAPEKSRTDRQKFRGAPLPRRLRLTIVKFVFGQCVGDLQVS